VTSAGNSRSFPRTVAPPPGRMDRHTSSLSDSARSTAPLFIGIGRSRSPSSIGGLVYSRIRHRAFVIGNHQFPQTPIDSAVIAPSYDRCLSLRSSHCRRRRAKSDRRLDVINRHGALDSVTLRIVDPEAPQHVQCFVVRDELRNGLFAKQLCYFVD
jgi:hypothetical protein